MTRHLLWLAAEAAPNGVLVVDTSGTIVIANPACERLFGYLPAETIGQAVDRVLPGVDAFNTSTLGRLVTGRCKDGSPILVQISLNEIETAGVLYMVVWIDDAPERSRRAEADRRTFEDRLAFERLVIELSASFVSLDTADIDAAIVDAQRRIGEALDLDRSTLFTRHDGPEDFVRTHGWIREEHPPSRASVTRHTLPWAFERILNGESIVFSSPDDIPDGRDREAIQAFGTQSGIALPLFVGGRIGGVITFGTLRARREWPESVRTWLQLIAQVFANALVRKRADAALQASEARFRTLADYAPVMIWVSGPDKLCTWFNRQWLEFVGRRLDQELGNGWAEGVHPDDFESCLQIYHDAFDRRATFVMQYRLRRHDGEWRWIFDIGAPHYADDGLFLGYLGSCVDITDERKSKEQLEAALEELKLAHEDLRHTQHALIDQERLHVLGQMASGIAHDINNALGPVSLYAATIRMTEPRLTPETHEYLNIIEQSVRDVAQTVDRLREFSRRRDASFEPAPVDLNDVMEQVQTITRARWKNIPLQRGISVQLQTDFAPALPAILGDEAEIRGALVNLVFNALDAMPNGGTMTLRTRHIDGDRDRGAPLVQVEVIDTGVGMSDEIRRRCLEPFFTTKGDRGTGLGLAMVYGAVKRHAAAIDIDSAPGAGTTIRLTFPAAADAVELPQTAGDRPADLGALRVLVIDDDPRLLKSLRDVLRRDGHSVVVARNGSSGIAAFHSAQHTASAFDVVLTDLAMPDLDGRKVAARIKSLSSTPIILLTGWGQQLMADDTPASVDRVLTKPPRLEEVREALAACCSRAGAKDSK